MNRDSVSWQGYIPAVITPFDRDGELDLDGFRELIEWLISERMHGIAVAGTTGEWFSLRPRERAELFRVAAHQVRGRITVLGGCTAYTPGEASRYAQAARDCAMDGILLSPPPYVVPSEREVTAFYRAVSDAVDIPICIYNWPRGTLVDMSVELLEGLCEIDNVVAVKNSTGDLGAFAQAFFAVKDHVRYFGFPMTELGIALLQSRGGDGTIGAGGVLGSAHPDFFNRIWTGDLDGARECAKRDRAIFEDWIAPDYSARFGSPQAQLKTAFALRGLPAGAPRPPLLPLADEEVERVRMTLERLGVLAAVA